MEGFVSKFVQTFLFPAGKIGNYRTISCPTGTFSLKLGISMIFIVSPTLSASLSQTGREEGRVR